MVIIINMFRPDVRYHMCWWHTIPNRLIPHKPFLPQVDPGWTTVGFLFPPQLPPSGLPGSRWLSPALRKEGLAINNQVKVKTIQNLVGDYLSLNIFVNGFEEWSLLNYWSYTSNHASLGPPPELESVHWFETRLCWFSFCGFPPFQ